MQLLRRALGIHGPLFTLVALFIVITYTGPLLYLALSLDTPRQPPFDILRILSWTTIQAAASATISTVVGWPIGILAGFYGHRLSLMTRIAGFPVFMAPSVAVVLGFIALYGSGGIVSQWITQARLLAQGWTGIIAVHSYYNIPLAIVLTYASAIAAEKPSIELIRLYHVSPHKLWFRVLLPISSRGAIMAWLLAFVYSFTGLAAPLMLEGTAYKYYTLEAWIYTLFYGFPGYLATAVWLAVFQILLLTMVAFALVVFSEYMPRATRFVRAGVLMLSRRANIIATIYTILVLVFLYAPLVAVVYVSFWDPYRGWSGLQNYVDLLTGEAPLPLGVSLVKAIMNTLAYALATASLSLIASIGVSWTGSRLLAALSFISIAASPVVLGLALYLSYYHMLASVIGPSTAPIPMIVLSHTAVSLPLAARSVWLGLTRLRRELLDMLLISGVKGWRLAFTLLSLSPSSLATAILLSIVASMGEFGATLVLSTPETWSLGILVYHLYGAGRTLGYAAAACSILLLFVLLVTAMGSRWLREWL